MEMEGRLDPRFDPILQSNLISNSVIEAVISDGLQQTHLHWPHPHDIPKDFYVWIRDEKQLYSARGHLTGAIATLRGCTWDNGAHGALAKILDVVLQGVDGESTMTVAASKKALEQNLETIAALDTFDPNKEALTTIAKIQAARARRNPLTLEGVVGLPERPLVDRIFLWKFHSGYHHGSIAALGEAGIGDVDTIPLIVRLINEHSRALRMLS